MKNKLLSIVIAVSIFVGLADKTVYSYADSFDIAMSTTSTTVTVDETFSVDVNLNTTISGANFNLTVTFEKDEVEYLGFTPNSISGFQSPTQHNATSISNANTNSITSAITWYALSDDNTEISPQKVVTVNFKAKKAGTQKTEIGFGVSRYGVVQPDLNTVSTNLTNAPVQIKIDCLTHTMGEPQDKNPPQPATCIADGLKETVCSTCGATEDVADTNRPAHSYGAWIQISPETCTEAETQYRTCQTIGCEDREEGTGTAALGHNFNGDYASVGSSGHAKECSNPGCTEIDSTIVPHTITPQDCTQERTCTEPTCTYTIPAGTHVPSAAQLADCTISEECTVEDCNVLIPARSASHTAPALTDCTVAGICTDSTCTQVARATTPHVFTNGDYVAKSDERHTQVCENCPVENSTTVACTSDNAQAADCTAENKCVDCSQVLLEAGKHTSWTSVDVNEHECDDCGITEFHVLATSWTVRTEPTCSTLGLEFKACTATGCDREVTQSIAINPANHTGNWGEWETVTAQTCLADGERKHKCLDCNEYVNEAVPSYGGHVDSNSYTETTTPSCDAQGEESSPCSNPNCDFMYTKAIDALGHDWTNYVTTTPPTCTVKGIETRSCKRTDCEVTENRDVEALGHDWGEYVITTPPTYTEKGVETRTCKRDGCEATENRDVEALEAPGHDWGEYVITTPPTCTEKGIETRTCKHTECEATEDREVEALGHDWSEWIETTAPTTSSEGVSTRICSICELKETQPLSKLSLPYIYPDTTLPDAVTTAEDTEQTQSYPDEENTTSDEVDATLQDDVVFDNNVEEPTDIYCSVYEKLKNNEIHVTLDNDTGTRISKEALQLIKDGGVPIDIVLPSGLTVTIDPEKIVETADFDLDIKVTPTKEATTIDGKDVSANSIVITPISKGNFGFEISFTLSADELAQAGLVAQTIKLYYIGDDGTVKEVSELLTINADGSVTIKISSASSYVLNAALPSDETNPATGIALGFIPMIITAGITAMTRKIKKSSNKK